MESRCGAYGEKGIFISTRSRGNNCVFQTDILYDSWSPAMTVSSVCISILSMLSSSSIKQRPADNDRYVKNCKNGRSPKETRWWFHDDKV
ncbi:hypothetical protein IEQ34_026543 [Dendrobium chrysotoxum]|uniref:UBC core domain-containing protein n=1 Tax=Dendrobium chrysotoxum TaxID=161865 RepID=A0AAV7FLW2_DENCH|nr:hypothetical protein IEQ34_026543 [Dendrobium chrysotoxum]